MAKEPGEIRQEIDATRDALAGTIQALGEKADIKGRMTDALQDGARTAKDHVVESVSEARSRLSNLTADPTQTLIGSDHPAVTEPADDSRVKVAAVLVAVLFVFLVNRRRRRRRRDWA